MKKVSILSLIILINLFSYAQSSDTRIANLFASQDFFTLKQEFPDLSKNASEQYRLLSMAYLDSYFNKPAQANETIQLLLQKYPDFLGEKSYLVALLMADNYIKEQNYRFAASIYEQLIAQWEPYLSDTALAPYRNVFQMYKVLENIEPMFVSYDNAQAIVPLKNDAVGLLTFPVKTETSETIDFVLDFGAGYSMIEEQYVDDFGIEILADSILAGSGVGIDIYSKIGIAKEIQIGEIKVQNVVFFIAPKILPESVSDSLHYEIKGIIGLPVLREWEHLTIKSSGELIVSKSTEKQKFPSNLIVNSNILYLQSVTPKNKLLMQFDSGGKRSHLTHLYLEKTKENTSKLIPDSISITSYGGTKKIPVYKKKKFQCKIGHKKITLPLIDIYKEEVSNYGMLPADGLIGRDIIDLNKETIIDFKNMTIDFQ